MSYILKLGVLLVSLFWIKSSLADTASMKNLKLAYDVFVGGMLAGSVDINAHNDLERYIIESQAHSQGIFEFLTGYRGNNIVIGHLNSQGLRPKYYESKGFWAGKKRAVEINYDFFNRLSYKVSPTPAEDDRDPVSPKFLLGTTDPMTALFGVLYQPPGAAVCDNELKVFDGRRRYDIRLSEVAQGETEGPIYTGSATVCRARQTILAGASKKIWFPQFARPKWTDIWIASVRPDLPSLPVRIKADLGIMDLVIHLVAIGDRKLPSGETPTSTLSSKMNWSYVTDYGTQQ